MSWQCGASNRRISVYVKTANSLDGKEKFTFFYGAKTLLGNFYPASFEIDGIIFKNSEQYFHYKKAGI